MLERNLIYAVVSCVVGLGAWQLGEWMGLAVWQSCILALVLGMSLTWTAR